VHTAPKTVRRNTGQHTNGWSIKNESVLACTLSNLIYSRKVCRQLYPVTARFELYDNILPMTGCHVITASTHHGMPYFVCLTSFASKEDSAFSEPVCRSVCWNGAKFATYTLILFINLHA